jgi:uncharacterized cupredoxin-like copper-binding protein
VVGATLRLASVAILGGIVAGCATGVAEATPPIIPGSSDAPREVNLITRDYSFVPNVLDLVPGETVLLHVINGGLVVHEAVIGDMTVQDAWEVAEAATVGAPPGPTPVVTVPAGVTGLRVVVQSGERVDVTWTVPEAVPATAGDGAGSSGASAGAGSSGTAGPAPTWLVGCHIPGHWARGMQIPIGWVHPGAAGQADPSQIE